MQKLFITFLSVVCMWQAALAQPALTGKIVYHAYSAYEAWDGQLFVLDLASGIRTNISAGWNVDHEINGHWSPDGTKLVFMGDVAGEPRNWDVFLWTVGAAQPVNLTNSAARDEDPKFSPDGQRIVFKSGGDIYQMDLSGTIINNVTNTPSIEESMPYYTADGNSILYTEGTRAAMDIYRINTNGTGRQAAAARADIQDYYPITRDNSSFYHAGWLSATDSHDQLYIKTYSGTTTSLPFNTPTADYSDPYPINAQYMLCSSTRPGGKGDYDVYLADVNTGQMWSLDQYNASCNSSLKELGAAYHDGQAPYGGTVRNIPGKIQAEDYDIGGEGVAYQDADAANQGAFYRTDGVDIETTTDAGGGYNVAYTATGEWLEYTVDVKTAGYYSFRVRVATTSSGGKIHAEMNGSPITGIISVPNTGGWQNWTTVSVITSYLTKGKKVLRLYIDTGGFNLNFVNFVFSSARLASEQVNIDSEQIVQTYPNPVSGQATIRTQFEKAGQTVISLHTLTGSTIRMVHNGYLNAGVHSFELQTGKLAPGVYFLRVLNDNKLTVRKIVKVE